MAAQGLLDSKDGCTVKQRGGRGAAPELIYHIHHSFGFNFTSPATFFFFFFCRWHLETKPCHMTCHITFINLSTIFLWRAARGGSYFQSCVYVGNRETWKVWHSPLLKKKKSKKKICHLDTGGWKRVTSCEHLIWIISCSRRQFSLPGQMDWDLLCQCWISKHVLLGHSQPL